MWGVRKVDDALVTKAEGPNASKFGAGDIPLSGDLGFASILQNILILDKRRGEESCDMMALLKKTRAELKQLHEILEGQQFKYDQYRGRSSGESEFGPSWYGTMWMYLCNRSVPSLRERAIRTAVRCGG